MALNTSFVKNVLMLIILLIITYQVLADTAADVGDAADSIVANSATLPLTSFFKKKGVVLLALMAGVVIALISAAMNAGGRN